MGDYAYSISDLGKVTSRGKKILEGISLSFFHGAKIGVLGLNGSGKSSLLRIMAGVDKEFLGEARPNPKLQVGFLPQEPQLDPQKTVRENIDEGVAETRALLTRFEEVNNRFAEELTDDEMDALLKEQADIQDAIEAAGAWELDREVEIAMDALRVPDGDTDVATLSGGEARRVALCRLVLSKPDTLLLDEPTNHLDAESVAWLERYLQEYAGTVIAVTHDRYFLDNVAGWILELDRGRGIPFKGNYTAWLEQKNARLEAEGKSEARRQRQLNEELQWVRSSQKARQQKGKARLNNYQALLEQSPQERIRAGTIYIPPGPRLGDVVFKAEGLTKAFGDRLLFDGLNMTVPPGATVGIVGPNGAGKTTLFRILRGEIEPDSGSLKVGETVQTAYVDQSRDALDDNKTVWEEISGGAEQISLGDAQVASRAYCSWFNFRGDTQQQKAGELSGGERNRLHMARLLRAGGNVLMLDEPTNDLDVDTLRSLEGALSEFAGAALVISHDRWFLDRICTHILAFEDDDVVFIEGNWQDYLADRKRRLGDQAINPHRIKYRRIGG